MSLTSLLGLPQLAWPAARTSQTGLNPDTEVQIEIRYVFLPLEQVLLRPHGWLEIRCSHTLGTLHG